MKQYLYNYFKPTEFTFLTTSILSLSLIIFSFVLLHVGTFLDDIEVNYFGNLSFMLYNLVLYLIGFVVSAVYFRFSLDKGLFISIPSSLPAAFFLYRTIGVFLDAYEGENQTWLIVSAIIASILVFYSIFYLLVRYLKSLKMSYEQSIEQKDNLLSKVLRFLEVADKKVGQTKASLKFSEAASGQITDMIDYGSYNPESENYIIYKGHIETINNWIGYKKMMGDIGIKEAEKTQRAMADLYNMIAELQEKEEK